MCSAERERLIKSLCDWSFMGDGEMCEQLEAWSREGVRGYVDYKDDELIDAAFDGDDVAEIDGIVTCQCVECRATVAKFKEEGAAAIAALIKEASDVAP